jgi:hypothetical protein
MDSRRYVCVEDGKQMKKGISLGKEEQTESHRLLGTKPDATSLQPEPRSLTLRHQLPLEAH